MNYSAGRSEKIKMMNDTLKICEQGYYGVGGVTKKLKLSADEMRAVRVFLPDELETLESRKGFKPESHVNGKCAHSCENIDSFAMAQKIHKDCRDILVLNLANPVNPGGGVRNGATAQEEDLCRKSTLLLSLESETAKKYYSYNKKLHTYMGSDAIIITPKVEIIKGNNGETLEETFVVAVMTCAAPMIKRGLEGHTEEEYRLMLYNRIDGMLRCAAFMGYKSLVLGAFGCGAFGNDARIVSDIFSKAIKEFEFSGLKEDDLFDRIDFAVLSKDREQYNFKEFYRNFGGIS